METGLLYRLKSEHTERSPLRDYLGLVAIVAVSLSIITACSPQTRLLLHANFESDGLQDLPNPSPPTTPVGDSIDAPYWARVYAGVFLNSRRVLRVPYPQWDSESLSLNSIDPPYESTEITAMWVGCKGDPSEEEERSGRVYIGLFLDGWSWPPIVQLEFEHGRIYARAGYDYLPTSVIGEYQYKGQHLVVIRISRLTQTFDVSVFHTEDPTQNFHLEGQPLHITFSRFYQPFSIRVSTSGGRVWRQAYELDDVIITSR